jgi:hypothetical protein
MAFDHRREKCTAGRKERERADRGAMRADAIGEPARPNRQHRNQRPAGHDETDLRERETHLGCQHKRSDGERRRHHHCDEHTRCETCDEPMIAQ